MEDMIEERIISTYPDALVEVALSGRNVEIKISSVTLSAFSRLQQQKKSTPVLMISFRQELYMRYRLKLLSKF